VTSDAGTAGEWYVDARADILFRTRLSVRRAGGHSAFGAKYSQTKTSRSPHVFVQTSISATT
jgi:hypothetical protein